MPVDYIGKPPLWLCRDHKHTNSLLQQVRLSSKERAVLGISTNALMHEPLMSWPELVELHKTGFDIQSHSFGHHFLTTLPEEQVIEDLARSREILEDRLGSPVRAIAYPYGAANPQVAAAARKAGFDVGFVSDHGPRDALNMMSWRGGVSGRLTAPELIAILRSWPLYPRLRHFFRQVSGLS
jgi:peptidoglycan/xylan/chitin deacetylase (PgdA/CDA1 family)